MSGKVGGSNGKGGIGISGIPVASRKMVLSLKEIVDNSTELEIYTMLKDCNMDPNETVNRLLAQGPRFFTLFHCVAVKLLFLFFFFFYPFICSIGLMGLSGCSCSVCGCFRSK